MNPKTVGSPRLVDLVSGPKVVISQVYGGGGNQDATLKYDYIELFNAGDAVATINNWSIQYASSAGGFNNKTTFSATIEPGHYFLIREAAGTGAGNDLPDADITTGAINFSATNGKIALVRDNVSLPCGTAGLCTGAALATIVDVVGYGTANFFEITKAPAPSNTTAIFRADKGCQDRGDNGADFSVADPGPRSSHSLSHLCQQQPPATVDHISIAPATATIPVGGKKTFSATALDANNQSIPGASFEWSTDPAISDVATVDAATGVATGLKSGEVSVIAIADGKAGTSSLRVTPATELPPVRFSELHYDNAGDDNDEQLEIEGPAGTDLTGWSVILYDAGAGSTPPHVYDSKVLTGTIPASCTSRGVVVVPFGQIQNGPKDAFALVHGSEVVEFLSVEGSMTATDGPAIGMTSTDIGPTEESNAPVLGSLQRDATTGTWTATPRRSFGRCNADGPPDFDIAFVGRDDTDPALPIGFEAQIFAQMSAKDGTADASSTFSWTSETPEIASIDARGVVHALSTGRGVFRATVANGTSVAYTIQTTTPVFSTTAVYTGNTEFGIPHDADASDDQIIVHPEFTSSYSRIRNTPNWVSWVVEASHVGSEDRCNCFTHDPLLPADFAHITTADYTDATKFAGFGIDRGHLARSADFTAAGGDNAMVYLFSNIVPQAADVNQGQWADEENFLGALARSATDRKDVYTIAGVAGSKGTLKNEGKVVMPASVWKVAVIVPHGKKLADIHDYRDLQVISVIMPNDPRPAGTPKPDWHTFETTVDAVEALSGYDLLDALPDKIERAVESGTQPPFAVLDGPYSTTEGASVSLNGSASFDPNGTVVSYAWSFGDGAAATGASVAHTYAQDQDYTVRLIATDNDGLADTTFTTAHISNVAPAISTLSTATLLPGEVYDASGTFTDPGADAWNATVDYGDGTGASVLPLSGKGFSLTHVYNAAGTFTVTVRVSDDDVTSTRTQFVAVMSQVAGLDEAKAIVADIGESAGLNSGNRNSMLVKLDGAKKKLGQGDGVAAGNQVGAALNELDALVRSGRVTEHDAAPLRTLLTRLVRSISI